MIFEILTALKEAILEHIKHRLFFVTILFMVLFGILVYRLFDLQIKHGEEYQDNFTYKTRKTVDVKASRGNIYDCNGNLLAYNESSYTLSFTTSVDISDAAKELDITQNQLRNEIVYKTIRILESNGDDISVSLPIIMDNSGNMEFTVSGQSLNTFRLNVYGASSVDALSDEQANATARDMFEYMKGEDFFNISEEYSDYYALKILAVRYEVWLNRYQQYITVDIADNISVNSYAAISENMDELLGMDVSIESHRVYVDSVYMANIIGYIGNISSTELEEYNTDLSEDEQYSQDDMIGKAGVEKVFESELRGTDGSEVMYVDNLGKVLEVIDSTDSVAGKDLYLTIDIDLQKYCYNAVERELASILLAHIGNVTEADDYDTIPITDVYAALFENNVIDIDDMKSPVATELEQSVYSSFETSKSNTLSRLDDILNSSHTPLYNLNKYYQEYMEYICVILGNAGIYSRSVVPDDDTVLESYINNQISLYEYLMHCISIGAIDISVISTESDYYDTDEIYQVVSAYILETLENDTDFDKQIFSNMILSGELTGGQVIELLFDQEILDENTDEDYQMLKDGTISNYEFMYRKIENLEITPAMLALDPCSASVVVVDTETGDVKALVSYPGYDNNMLTNSIDAEYYNKLISDKTTPMYNRATLQRTAPGSTFKMITAVAGMEEGVISTTSTINATGLFDKIAIPAKCWIYPNGSHGTINVTTALEVSCNYFFYEVGYRLACETLGNEDTYRDSLGLEKIRNYASMFGLDSTSGIELPENDPIISDNDAVRTAIGQGTNNYTASQLARYVTTIANEGTCYNLSIVQKVQDIDGNLTYDESNEIYNTIDLPAAEWSAVKQGMRQVVSEHTSSGALINQIDVKVAGKTGTAQEDTNRPNHALFVSFAPYDNPEVSVTCVIPNGYSSGNAEELAAFIYSYMYDPEAAEQYNATGDNQVSD